ncbi:MAG: ABC transporter ATP-binding protein [Peptostreptococcaceae bacterium]|nr:ABC transporter ATP-binding protein [Peptostreptococcaceae bacterium]
MSYHIEMINITKEFPGIIANDNITLQVERGEIHALLGENGAGKSTLMSVLFGLYQPEKGVIKKNGEEVKINDPNDANRLGIGMVHQHFKLVENFTVLENIVLGAESVRMGMLKMDDARKRVVELSQKYNLAIDPEAKIEDITVGMQQRVEILKMLYRENEILIFDEPTAVLTAAEIDELMDIMLNLVKEGKSIVFITHKLNEIKKVADRCTVLRKGKYIGTVDVAQTSKEELSKMMVGRNVDLVLEKTPADPKEAIFEVKNLTMRSKTSSKNVLNDVSFNVRRGEIVAIAGIEGNGQSELVYAISGLMGIDKGEIILDGDHFGSRSVRYRSTHGLSHIPEDRHKFGLVLDYTLAENMILQTYFTKDLQKNGFLNKSSMRKYSDRLIKQYDVRSAQGSDTVARSMSGGNQQKAIIAREIDKDPSLLIAVQPTRGLDVGAIEYIHKQLLKVRDEGKGVLLVSLEIDEVMSVSDRIIVIYEGELVGEFDPKTTTVEELGLYMSGSKRREMNGN